MSNQVFDRLPGGLLRRFWHCALEGSIELVKYYLEGRAHEAPTTSRDIPQELPSLAARTEEHHEGYRTI